MKLINAKDMDSSTLPCGLWTNIPSQSVRTSLLLLFTPETLLFLWWNGTFIQIGRFVSGLYSGEKCFEPESESTDSARKAVEKLQADGKLVQMAKVIATVKFSGVLLVFFQPTHWNLVCSIFKKPNIDGVLIESRLETRRGPDKYLFFKSSGLDWRQSIERNAWTIWWCGQHTNPTTSSKSNTSPPISRDRTSRYTTRLHFKIFYYFLIESPNSTPTIPKTFLVSKIYPQIEKLDVFSWNRIRRHNFRDTIW